MRWNFASEPRARRGTLILHFGRHRPVQRNGALKPWSSLRQAAAINLDDGFEFAIGAPTLDLDAAPYGGARFPVDAQMAGRRFAQFHLDVSSGDVLREPYEVLEGRDWFGFAGLSRARVPAVSREEQFAEKLHAYSLPREGRPNSRVKDLVDLALLIEQQNWTSCPSAESHSRHFSKAKDARSSDRAGRTTGFVVRAICGDGAGMRHWNRTSIIISAG
jgi:hypothetical protein